MFYDVNREINVPPTKDLLPAQHILKNKVTYPLNLIIVATIIAVSEFNSFNFNITI